MTAPLRARSGTRAVGAAQNGTERHGTALRGAAPYCTARHPAALHPAARHPTAHPERRYSADYAPPSDASLLAALPLPLRELAAQGLIRRYRSRTTLIEEGDNGDTLFIILAGTVRIFCSGPRDREITLALYGAGEYAGEMSLDGGTRSASVATETPVICAIVTGQTLRRHLATSPAFALDLIVRTIRRARLATESARSLALVDAFGRMTRLFDSLAVAQAGGARVITPRLTHRQIAERIGCSRELVTRLLKDLETSGHLALREGQMLLLKALPQRR